MDATAKKTLHESMLRGAVRELLKSPDGRYFLRWLVLGNRTLEAAYPADHATAAFREGARAVGCAVLALAIAENGAQTILREEAE